MDRLTSGLTILAKTAERAGIIQAQIGEPPAGRAMPLLVIFELLRNPWPTV